MLGYILHDHVTSQQMACRWTVSQTYGQTDLYDTWACFRLPQHSQAINLQHNITTKPKPNVTKLDARKAYHIRSLSKHDWEEELLALILGGHNTPQEIHIGAYTQSATSSMSRSLASDEATTISLTKRHNSMSHFHRQYLIKSLMRRAKGLNI